MSLTREQSVNLRVGQTVTTKTFTKPGKITKIVVVADGERIITIEHPGEAGRSFITWLGETQIDSVVSA